MTYDPADDIRTRRAKLYARRERYLQMLDEDPDNNGYHDELDRIDRQLKWLEKVR